jgi:hypothetical protein
MVSAVVGVVAKVIQVSLEGQRLVKKVIQNEMGKLGTRPDFTTDGNSLLVLVDIYGAEHMHQVEEVLERIASHYNA